MKFRKADKSKPHNQKSQVQPKILAIKKNTNLGQKKWKAMENSTR